MGQLRKTIQREIIDALDSSYFTSNDFEVSFEDDDVRIIFSIIFIHDKSLYYRVEKHSHQYYARMSPGDFEQEDMVKQDDFSSSIHSIKNWCSEVRNELKASKPIYKEVDALREIIEEHIIGGNDDEEFSVEEINELHKKFEELNARVSDLEEQQVITTKQKQEFTEGVNQVSEDLEYYPKKTWVKTASSKLVNLVTAIGKSKEGRKLLESGAKKLLGLE